MDKFRFIKKKLGIRKLKFRKLIMSLSLCNNINKIIKKENKLIKLIVIIIIINKNIKIIRKLIRNQLNIRNFNKYIYNIIFILVYNYIYKFCIYNKIRINENY